MLRDVTAAFYEKKDWTKVPKSVKISSRDLPHPPLPPLRELDHLVYRIVEFSWVFFWLSMFFNRLEGDIPRNSVVEI